MSEVRSASFAMERTGAVVTIQGMAFDGATGEFQAPHSARALLRVRASDLSIELGSISVGERTWLTNPLAGGWELVDPDLAFNPADLFDVETGWRQVLEEATDAEYLGRIGDRDRVQATVAGDRVRALTAGVAEAQPASLVMEIDPETSLLVRLEFDTTGQDGVSSWTIDLGGYDEPVQIDPPAAAE